MTDGATLEAGETKPRSVRQYRKSDEYPDKSAGGEGRKRQEALKDYYPPEGERKGPKGSSQLEVRQISRQADLHQNKCVLKAAERLNMRERGRRGRGRPTAKAKNSSKKKERAVG